MQDNKALQMGTSHNLGQNFAKAFELAISIAAAGSSNLHGIPHGAFPRAWWVASL